jgi:hypothetical protein
MKYLKSFELFERNKTPQDTLDLFNNRIQSYDLDNKFKLSIERTKSSFKVIIVDKTNNKTVSRIYIQDIRKVNGKFIAEIRRLHVNDEYRGLGFGDKVLSVALNTFSDIELYGYASPNRNKDMKDEEREDYRQRLFNFYSKHNLNRVSDKSFKVVRKVEEQYTTILERHYKDLSDRDKEDFDDSEFTDDENGNFQLIYYTRPKGGTDRIWWDKKRKLKRKQSEEEYYSTHGYED